MKIKYFYTYIIAILFLNACVSAQKSFDRKDYDTTVSTIINKISKNKKVSDEEVLLLRDAYDRVLEVDKSKISAFKKLNTVSSWSHVFDLYTTLINRQNAIQQISPIYLSNGESIEVDYYDFNPVREEAREKVATLHYDEAKKLLQSSLRSDARKAYEHLDCIFYYYKDFLDADQLMDIAQDKGTAHILLTVDKNPQLFLPQNYEYELLNFDYSQYFDKWVAIYTHPDDRSQFDFAVRLILTDSYISPGSIKETSYVDEKEIKEGWQYVYDSRGNVMKDSLGNDIKTPKYVKYTAKVLETFMHREAIIRGNIDFYDIRNRRTALQELAQGQSVFDYTFAISNGNRNALSSESIKKLQNAPAPFPSDIDMITLATNELKSQFANVLRNNKRIFD